MNGTAKRTRWWRPTGLTTAALAVCSALAAVPGAASIPPRAEWPAQLEVVDRPSLPSPSLVAIDAAQRSTGNRFRLGLGEARRGLFAGVGFSQIDSLSRSKVLCLPVAGSDAEVRNRYYDPEIGRFITTDPLGYVDGPSLYGFAGNDPVNGGDPLGLEKFTDAQRREVQAAGQAARAMREQREAAEREAALQGFKAEMLGRVSQYEPGSPEQREELSRQLLAEGFGQAGTVAWTTELLGPSGQCSPGRGEVICQVARDTAGVPDVLQAGTELAMAIGGAAGLVDDVVRVGARVVVPRGGQTVLGKFPDYINLADDLGARRFNIPQDVWARMTKAEQWTANQKFLDRMIRRGDDIILSNPVKNVNEVTGTFRQELDYLIQQGFRLSDDGTRLLR